MDLVIQEKLECSILNGLVYTVRLEKKNGNKVKILMPKIKIKDNKILRLICCCLQSYLQRYSWGVGATVKSISNIKFNILTKNGKIDFAFMESFIAEPEAYLTATNLKDYTLTEEERICVERFEKVEWADVKFDEIFNNIKQGKRLKKADQLEGSIPFVM